MRFHPFFLFPFALLALTNCAPENANDTAFKEWLADQNPSFDYLITNGLLYDGLDTVPKETDLLIRRDSIAYIGRVDTSLIEVRERIDAAGRVVCPGFIDTHAHGDPLQTPGFENFLAMGVTTICLGQDGASPPPQNISQWMQQVADTIPGVNVALLVGHGTLRLASGAGYDPVPEPAALDSMKTLLTNALEAGCYGLSTGLEYTPGIYAQDEELLALAKIVGGSGGVIMSHMRNEDDGAIEASLDELLRQGQFANVHAAHLKVVYGKGAGRAEEILQRLADARRGGFSVTADVYPYTASYTGIGIVFPDWAKAPNDYNLVKKERRAELLQFLREKVGARNGPEATLFGSAPYAGQTLAELSREQGKPYEEVLLDIGPTGASAAYFVMDEALQARLLADPHVMVSSDGSPTMRHPRGYGSFAKIIEQYVLQEKTLSLGEAVRKMTSLPARTLGLTDRGVLAVGKKADLLVFDPGLVQANATFEAPHRLAAGFDWVLVNGGLALGQVGTIRRRSGRILRR